jgi:hypothetical protein
LNRAQITLDLIYDAPAERDAAHRHLDVHLIRRWHRRTQPIRYYDDDATLTRYDAPRRAANRIIVYAEEHSRATGELYCLHVEWDAVGRRAVVAAGLAAPRDVLTFDHRENRRSQKLAALPAAQAALRFASEETCGLSKGFGFSLFRPRQGLRPLAGSRLSHGGRLPLAFACWAFA